MSINKQLVQTARALRLKKGLSQNFLVDDRILHAITTAADTLDKSLPIVEIGPGAGFLTEHLLKTGHPLTAIEVDSKMIRVLEERFAGEPNFSLIHKDVRQVDLLPLLSPQGIVVGNLPYHLTGPILFQLAGELRDTDYPLRQHIVKAIIMVQKEVGDRLVAAAGSKAYSQLTLQIQYWFEVTPVAFVPRGAFYPSPAVDSSVVQLVPRKGPAVVVKDPELLGRLIKTCFLHRRKTLYNNLRMGSFGAEEQLKGILQDLGISQEARPQEIAIEQFGALSDVFCDLR